MPSLEAIVSLQAIVGKIFNYGPQEQFEEMDVDPRKLYFTSDTHLIYKGSTLYSDAIRVKEERPEIPAEGKIYYISSTKSYDYYVEGTWYTLLTLQDDIDISLPEDIEAVNEEDYERQVNDILRARLQDQIPSAWAIVSLFKEEMKHLEECLSWQPF